MTADQATAMIVSLDNASRALHKAREKAFTALGSVTGAQYIRIQEALTHVDKARVALRGL